VTGSGPIHVIGDSHVSVFTGLHGVCGTVGTWCPQALPGFLVSHLGPFLAYSAASAGHAVQHALQERIPRTAGRCLFSFGEIDCRNQVVRRARAAHVSIEAMAASVARSYVEHVRELARERDIGFLAVPPATCLDFERSPLPAEGSLEERRRAVGAFNATIERCATAVGAAVVDVATNVTLADGTPDPAYFPDGLHLGPRSLPVVLGRLQEVGWIDREHPAWIAARALAMVPPCVDGRELLPGRLDDPLRARHVLLELAVARLQALGARNIAIWGAGQHTQALGLAVFERAGLHVRAIVDDNPSLLELEGCPVVTPPACPRDVDAILISSDAHERAIVERAKQVFGGRLPIMPLYAWESIAAPAGSPRHVAAC
jgi:hypothetical protein